MARLLVLAGLTALLAGSLAQQAPPVHHDNCSTHGRPTAEWISDPAFQRRAAAKTLNAVTPPVYTVNLDLPADERWNEVGQAFASQAYLIEDYIKSFVPPWLYNDLINVAADLESYKGFGPYADEVCVCVCERDGERERERESVCVCVCVCVCE